MEERGARQAINLDHEVRLLRLEDLMSALEKDVALMKPDVNEILIAQRVTAGVRAAIEDNAKFELGRWTKLSIAGGVVGYIASLTFQILHLAGHG